MRSAAPRVTMPTPVEDKRQAGHAGSGADYERVDVSGMSFPGCAAGILVSSEAARKTNTGAIHCRFDLLRFCPSIIGPYRKYPDQIARRLQGAKTLLSDPKWMQITPRARVTTEKPRE